MKREVEQTKDRTSRTRVHFVHFLQRT